MKPFYSIARFCFLFVVLINTSLLAQNWFVDDKIETPAAANGYYMPTTQVNSCNAWLHTSGDYYLYTDGVEYWYIDDDTNEANGVLFFSLGAIPFSSETPFEDEWDQENGVNKSHPVLFSITSTPLPVELTTFSYQLADGKIELLWETATETNNLGFGIEKKTNTEWTEIAFVEGAGNSNSVKKYSYVDNSGNYLNSSYRLKQVDFDGSFEYSKVVEFIADMKLEYTLSQNYPNPFNPTTQIKFSIPKEGNVSIKIFDITGQEIIELLNDAKEAGEYSVDWNGVDRSGIKVASGLYLYTIQAEAYRETRKMLLLK